jgi:DNA repair photolyase
MIPKAKCDRKRRSLQNYLLDPEMHETDADFIHGTAERLFLNTDLGCASSCAYCYLPTIGLPVGRRISGRRTTAGGILGSLTSDSRFRAGPDGTVLSIGCFSECWDTRNRAETLNLVSRLLPLGNQIQLATKRQIKAGELDSILQDHRGKKSLTIYISSSTISRWHEFERGTTRPEQRFLGFETCRTAGLRAFLYIKPVLTGVTILDVPEYGRIMNRYGVAAVVGERFESQSLGATSSISSRLRVTLDPEVTKVRSALAAYGRTFGNSTEPLNRHAIGSE